MRVLQSQSTSMLAAKIRKRSIKGKLRPGPSTRFGNGSACSPSRAGRGSSAAYKSQKRPDCVECTVRNMKKQRIDDCRQGADRSLVRLTEPYSVGELIILQSVLDGSGIPYVVRHANMSSLYPGVPALRPQVYVEKRDLPRAEYLLGRLRLEVRDVSDGIVERG